MRTNFQIDGVTIKTPHTFRIERFRITKSNRLASGSMSMELVAKKRKFYFTYDAIESSDLNIILDALWETDNLFYTLSYIESNERKTAIVYVGSIPTELHRTDDSNWVWKNVTFDLIER
jgi:hypothetical protein